jgi:hypothetical protein
MSETPQSVLERYIRDGGIITLPHIREAIRAVLAENVSLSEELGEVLFERDAAVQRAEDCCRMGEKTCAELVAERDALRAEVERLRDIISPGDAAAYEEGMAALQQRADVANVALLDAVKVRGELRVAQAALRIIAGEAQCADNLMSNVEVARAALAPEGKPKHASYCGDSRGPDPLCGGCGMPWPALEVK